MECTPELVDSILRIVERMIQYTEFDRYFPKDVADELLNTSIIWGYSPAEASEFWRHELRRPEKIRIIEEAERTLNLR